MLHYVSFTAPVNGQTAQALLGLCTQLVNNSVSQIYLLLSTPGGSVMDGMTVYNVLKGLPVELTTHNVGNVDSIGNVIFLAGKHRYACKHATFMFHGVGAGVPKDSVLGEKDVKEKLGSIQADQRRIGAIIAERSRLETEKVEELFLEATTRDPDYALTCGLIDEIRDVQIPKGAPVHQLVFAQGKTARSV